MNLKSWIFTFIPFVVLCCVKGFAQGIPSDSLKNTTGLCYCVDIPQKTTVYKKPGSIRSGTLSTGSAIRIGKVSRNWVQVFFTDSLDKVMCNGTRVHADSGWVRQRDLKTTALIAEDFIPLMGNQATPLIKIRKDKQNQFWEEFSVLDKDSSLILEISQNRKPGLNPVSYSILYTGMAAYPFALFYSGQMSQTFIDPPELVLFGHQDIKTWYPHDGYRIWAELKDVNADNITIREAFAFRTAIDVKLTWNEGNIQREFGVFPEGSGMLPARTRSAEPADSLRLSEVLEVFETKTKQTPLTTLDTGTQVELHLLEVDYPAKAVYLKVNKIQGWARLGVVRSLLLPLGDDGE